MTAMAEYTLPPGVMACARCDLLVSVRAEDLAARCLLRCPRCCGELLRPRPARFEHTLALVCAALILLLLANVFPVIGLNIQGHHVESTLIGAARRLWLAGMPLLAGFVGITTILVPALELLAISWVVQALWRGRRPRCFATIVRALHALQPWGMVEVFMLGILVALVKLAHLAEILPGPGIWAYGVLMLLFTAISASCDRALLWRAWEEAAP